MHEDDLDWPLVARTVSEYPRSAGPSPSRRGRPRRPGRCGWSNLTSLSMSAATSVPRAQVHDSLSASRTPWWRFGSAARAFPCEVTCLAFWRPSRTCLMRSMRPIASKDRTPKTCAGSTEAALKGAGGQRLGAPRLRASWTQCASPYPTKNCRSPLPEDCCLSCPPNVSASRVRRHTATRCWRTCSTARAQWTRPGLDWPMPAAGRARPAAMHASAPVTTTARSSQRCADERSSRTPPTETADPGDIERFLTNVLPVRIEATRMRSALCHHSHPGDILDAHPCGALPAFYLHDGRLSTFSDLGDSANALAAYTYDSFTELPVDEFLDGGDRQRLLVQLLNRTMFGHAASLGLSVHSATSAGFGTQGSMTGHEPSPIARVSARPPGPSRSLCPGAATVHAAGNMSPSAFRFGATATIGRCTWCRVGRSLTTGATTSCVDPRSRRLPHAARRATTTRRSPTTLYFWLWVLTRGHGRASIDPFSEAVTVEGRFVTLDSADVPAALAGFDADVGDADDVTQEVVGLDDAQAA